MDGPCGDVFSVGLDQCRKTHDQKSQQKHRERSMEETCSNAPPAHLVFPIGRGLGHDAIECRTPRRDTTRHSHCPDEQRHAYTLAHLGEYQCEFKRMIRVLAHPRQEGYVDLHFDKQVVTARPVLSSTGAVRLEDVKGRYLMVQIAFKSMLMDTKLGQRVADECLHDAHHDARRAAAEAPPAEGLGITGPGPTN